MKIAQILKKQRKGDESKNRITRECCKISLIHEAVALKPFIHTLASTPLHLLASTP